MALPRSGSITNQKINRLFFSGYCTTGASISSSLPFPNSCITSQAVQLETRPRKSDSSNARGLDSEEWHSDSGRSLGEQPPARTTRANASGSHFIVGPRWYRVAIVSITLWEEY